MYGDRAALPGRRWDNAFNDWMSRKLYVLVDEFHSTAASNMRIKHLLTSEGILIEQQAVKERIEPNKMNFVFLTGDINALKADACDRRFMVITPEKSLPPSVYAATVGELANGGLDAFYHFLTVELCMDDFSPRTLPANNASNLKEAA